MKTPSQKRRTVEALNKKEYVSELVNRVARTADDIENGSKIAETAEPVKEKSKTSRRTEKAKRRIQKKQSDQEFESCKKYQLIFLRMSGFLNSQIIIFTVRLRVWFLIGWLLILISLVALSFWLGTVLARPRYVMAHAETTDLVMISKRTTEDTEHKTIYFLSRSPVRSTKKSTPARSMILVDRASGHKILYDNADTVMPIASLTKLMTAHVVVNTWTAEDQFKILAEVDPKKESSSGLLVGETYTRDALLYALLLESSGEAGYTFADTFTGGRTAFIEKMNATAIELGMDSTSFVDPVGIGEENKSTATAIALLTRALLANKSLAQVVSTSSIEICSVENSCKTLKSTNKLLTETENFFGVKTGYTVKAGPCLSAWYSDENSDFVVVLLYVRGQGTDPRFEIAKELSFLARSVTM